ncbi:serine hydrolase domain-containing protein [Streptomyces sp. NPDC048057]|uniref:serine hydrolase domain-containing protein n=1 Tax=Streptomyces sp. NPDC048057 TaxID=3155628 RepID=UPI0033E5AE2D
MAIRAGVVGMTAAALVVTAFAVPAQGQDHRADGRGTERPTQRAIEQLVAAGVPGAAARADKQGEVWKGTAGVADRRTGKPRAANEHFRIGSITKTFVATVLLQLEAEGQLSLDDTVERHLPGLIRDGGNDGRTITVRQLLNHSSGLPDYLGNRAFRKKHWEAPGFFQYRYASHAPEDLLRVGLERGRDFAPGTRHEYSNTGYIVAGMIIEKVTGNSYPEEIRRRIVKPLKLRGTSSPGTTVTIPQPSARAYDSLTLPGQVYDVTELNPSIGGAAGDMISTTKDLNRFFGALLGGKLLPKKQLNAMKTTLYDPGSAGAGLGVFKMVSSCGTVLWGHDGGIPGWAANAVVTDDGKHALSYSVNGLDGMLSPEKFGAVPNAEYCGLPDAQR